MITLTTGLPGGGKSLYTICYIKQLSETENRPVFYHGIKDLALSWIHLEDPTKWHECPEGAIIVIDECQSTFRPRANGSAVPKHVAELETHRHKGHDLYLITQHPMLLDPNVRRLIGKHFHVVRNFGFNKATIHEWNQLKESPDKTRSDSIRHDFIYPKEAFSYYKSAEVHTVKGKLPARIYMLLVIPFLVAGLVWSAFAVLSRSKDAEANNGSFESKSMQPALYRGKEAQKPDYIEARLPRIAGMPQTSPIYDDLTRPVEVPYPAACVLIRNECTCYTQQATRLETDEGICRQIVANGYFLDFVRKPQRSDELPRRNIEKESSEKSSVLTLGEAKLGKAEEASESVNQVSTRK
jgi:zona occludens toxin